MSTLFILLPLRYDNGMDSLLSVPEVAKELDVSEGRVRQLIYADELPAERVGWQWVIRRPDLEAYKEQRRPPGRPPSDA